MSEENTPTHHGVGIIKVTPSNPNKQINILLSEKQTLIEENNKLLKKEIELYEHNKIIVKKYAKLKEDNEALKRKIRKPILLTTLLFITALLQIWLMAHFFVDKGPSKPPISATIENSIIAFV